MRRRRSWVMGVMGLITFALILGGCGDEGDSGILDEWQDCKGKCDAINPQNDPYNLGFGIKYELADESKINVSLISTFTPYSPPTYYPFTSDGINERPYTGTPSPAEKFDLAFSNWQPDDAFWSYVRLEYVSDRQFDQRYYDNLGPVALWEHMNHGLGRLHDGVDNDGDGETDFDDDNNEGLESWFGYCNGNTAASLSVPGPSHSARMGEVEFTSNDIMALLAAIYYGDRSTMTGLRCNAHNPMVDEWGRLIDRAWYRTPDDSTMRFFDILEGPVWIDQAAEKVGYLAGIDDPSVETNRALIRLDYRDFMKHRIEIKDGEISFDGEEWKTIEFSVIGIGCRDTNPATLYLAVTNLLGMHGVPFGIDADSGSHVWNYPIYEAIIREQRMIDKREANQLIGIDQEGEYIFNEDATKFAYVELTLLKSHSMSVEMVLELDDNEKVLGGEWVASSRTYHPDFIWVPMGADSTGYNTKGTYVTFGDDLLDGYDRGGGQIEYSDAPDMKYSDVRRLLAMSRTSDDDIYHEYDGEGATVAQGQTVSKYVTVDEDGVVKNALVYLDIKAGSVPGLTIKLVGPHGDEVDLFSIPPGSGEYMPGRAPQGHDLGVISGVAHPMAQVNENGVREQGLSKLNNIRATGDWELRVENIEAGNVDLKAWSLWLTTGPAE